MRRFLKLIIGLAILINLNACMTAEEALTKYNNMPEKIKAKLITQSRQVHFMILAKVGSTGLVEGGTGPFIR